MIEKHWSTLEESHLFRKGLDSKYFWFCEPCSLCGNYSKTKINEHDCGPIKSLFAKGAVTFGQEVVVCWPLLYIIITSRSLEFNIVPLRPQLLMPLMTMVILKVKGIRILPQIKQFCLGTLRPLSENLHFNKPLGWFDVGRLCGSIL